MKPLILEMWKTQPTFTNSDLSMIKTPLLVMVGEKDEMIYQKHTMEMAESLGNAGYGLSYVSTVRQAPNSRGERAFARHHAPG